MFRELRALGANRDVAHRIAANSRRWWRNSGKLLNSVLNLAWFDRLELPRLAYLNLSNRPVRTRMPGGGAGALPSRQPLCRFVGEERKHDAPGKKWFTTRPQEIRQFVVPVLGQWPGLLFPVHNSDALAA